MKALRWTEQLGPSEFEITEEAYWDYNRALRRETDPLGSIRLLPGSILRRANPPASHIRDNDSLLQPARRHRHLDTDTRRTAIPAAHRR